MKSNKNSAIIKRVIRYKVSSLIKPEEFKALPFKLFGVEIKKLTFDETTRIATFIFTSSLKGRQLLADAIRSMDTGWSTTTYWKEQHQGEDELDYVSNW